MRPGRGAVTHAGLRTRQDKSLGVESNATSPQPVGRGTPRTGPLRTLNAPANSLGAKSLLVSALLRFRAVVIADRIVVAQDARVEKPSFYKLHLDGKRAEALVKPSPQYCRVNSDLVKKQGMIQCRQRSTFTLQIANEVRVWLPMLLPSKMRNLISLLGTCF